MKVITGTQCVPFVHMGLPGLKPSKESNNYDGHNKNTQVKKKHLKSICNDFQHLELDGHGHH